MENVVLIVHLILALLLIGVVLLQRSEGGGLGMGGGGAMAGRQPANAMSKLTWLFAIAFIGTSIALTIFAARNSHGTSVVDQFGGSAPQQAPAAPETPLGGDLLPPAPVNAPLTPPRADEGEPAMPAPVAPEAPVTPEAVEPSAVEPAPAPAEVQPAPAQEQAPAPATEAPADPTESAPAEGVVPSITYPPAVGGAAN